MNVWRSLGTASTIAIQAQIVAAAQAQGVDPNLALAVAKQESGFNPSAVSSAGAIGVFQLMPATAAGLGVNPYDTTQNIQGGIAYLSQMLTQFNGNTALALAAYNAGPGAVTSYGGIPPYTQTQNYVSSIMSALPSMSTSGEAEQALDAVSSTNYDVSGTSSTTGLDFTDPTTLILLGLAATAAYFVFDSK